MPLSTDWRLKLLGYDFTAKTEWDVDIEETLGQPSVARFRLQDEEMGLGHFVDLDPGGVGFTTEELYTLVELDGAAMPLFQGKILNDQIDTPNHFPWRLHQINATDFQREIFDRRYVGTPDGYTWEGPNSDGNYTAVDGGALFDGGLISAAVKSLFDNYAGIPAFIGTVDAETFVRDYGSLSGAPYLADKATVRQIMEYFAGQVGGNLQYWMDTLFRIHWQVIPRWFEQESPEYFAALGLPTTIDPMEAAPVEIDNDNPDGVTSIGCRNLGWGFDYSNILHQHYISGSVGYKYNGGIVDRGGTGWVVFGNESAVGKNIAQGVLDVPSAVDIPSKLAAARRAEHSVAQGILRGHLTVGNERHHPDGWHVGQYLKITDARMGNLSGRYYPIQRVRTRLIPFINWRVYDIEWGDAPLARASSRRPTQEEEDAKLKDPGRLWDIAGRVQNPLPGSTVTVVGQLVDEMGNAKRLYGLTIDIELHVWDDTGAPVTGVGSLSASTVTTDTMGRWQVDMTVGSQPGYSYCVCEAGSGSCSIGS